MATFLDFISLSIITSYCFFGDAAWMKGEIQWRESEREKGRERETENRKRDNRERVERERKKDREEGERDANMLCCCSQNPLWASERVRGKLCTKKKKEISIQIAISSNLLRHALIALPSYTVQVWMAPGPTLLMAETRWKLTRLTLAKRREYVNKDLRWFCFV